MLYIYAEHMYIYIFKCIHMLTHVGSRCFWWMVDPEAVYGLYIMINIYSVYIWRLTCYTTYTYLSVNSLNTPTYKTVWTHHIFHKYFVLSLMSVHGYILNKVAGSGKTRSETYTTSSIRKHMYVMERIIFATYVVCTHSLCMLAYLMSLHWDKCVLCSMWTFSHTHTLYTYMYIYISIPCTASGLPIHQNHVLLT